MILKKTAGMGRRFNKGYEQTRVNDWLVVLIDAINSIKKQIHFY